MNVYAVLQYTAYEGSKLHDIFSTQGKAIDAANLIKIYYEIPKEDWDSKYTDSWGMSADEYPVKGSNYELVVVAKKELK